MDNYDHEDYKIKPTSPKTKINDAKISYQGLKKLSDILPILTEKAQSVGNRSFYKGNSRGISSLVSFIPKMQNSTVIVKYTSNNSKGLWKAHGHYLQRENAQKDGEKGLGFNQDSLEINIGQALETWQQAEDPRLWKIMISPELGEKLDLKEHTRLFVKELEKDLSTKLEWVAVDHYNTDNPHVHLLIRGKDDKGQPLDIDSGYLKSGMRLRSQEISTNQLGYRTESQAEYVREKQIDSYRFTSLDQAILKRSKESRHILLFSLDDQPPSSEASRKYRMQLLRRLKKLESLGFAEKQDNKTWVIHPNLKENLKAIGEYSAAIKIVERHRSKMTDQYLEIIYTTLKNPGEKVIGRILGAGLDPESDKPYLLIEGIDGKAHYLTQSKEIQAARLNSELVDSHIACIEVKSFIKEEHGTNKVIEYLEVKDFGHKITENLLDREILSMIRNEDNFTPNVEKINNHGFAKEFAVKLEKRIELLAAQGIIMLNPQGQDKYQLTSKYPYLMKFSLENAADRLGKILTMNYIVNQLHRSSNKLDK